MILFYIIIAILVADYALNQTLDHLNSTWRTKPIPPELAGIYDDEKYKKQQSYSQTVSRFSLIESTVMLVATLAFFFLDGFKFVDGIASSATGNILLQGLLFIAILFVATDIISTPFDIYDTFVIEQKYGFNTTTRKLFITDKLKGYLVTAIIGGGLYSLIYWFYATVGQQFWIYAWIAVSAFSLFMSMFYSTLIVPLFNKQTPLPEGELRDALNQFSQKVGFNLDGIFVIDNSKRSTRANAYFTGLGKKKTHCPLRHADKANVDRRNCGCLGSRGRALQEAPHSMVVSVQRHPDRNNAVSVLVAGFQPATIDGTWHRPAKISH